MSDGDLVRQTLSGNKAAYEELVRRWAARIMAVCQSRVGRPDIAEEMAQETLLRGFRHLHTLHDPETFSSWLTGIAVRTCLDWLKARERAQVPFSTLAPNGDLDSILNPAERDGPRGEQVADLMAAVQELPEIYRETLLLYYHDDVTYQQLADMLGTTAATVNARLTKGRKMLRERLEKTWS
jgi:RNA polymerase sigma-70 factor (ECF subfamily)